MGKTLFKLQVYNSTNSALIDLYKTIKHDNFKIDLSHGSLPVSEQEKKMQTLLE